MVKKEYILSMTDPGPLLLVVETWGTVQRRVSAGICYSVCQWNVTPACDTDSQPWTSIEVLKPVGEHSDVFTLKYWRVCGLMDSRDREGRTKRRRERGGERKREKGKHSWRKGAEEGTEQERKTASVLLNHFETQCLPQVQEKTFAKFKWQYIVCLSSTEADLAKDLGLTLRKKALPLVRLSCRRVPPRCKTQMGCLKTLLAAGFL